MSIVAAILLAAPLASAPPVQGIESLSRLDLLPAYRRATFGAVTSFDPTEGNDDGFSGKYSFVRKEGDALVLADLKGPGCITRIHTPTPTDDPLEFYFDGETKPRLVLPFKKLFSGDAPPFVRPLVDEVGGGSYAYVPIPYAKSCKIVLRGPAQFYDLNFATYPPGTAIRSFDPKAFSPAAIRRARAVFAGGRDADLTAFNVPPGTRLARKRISVKLPPGGSATLFQSDRPGRIASLRLGPASAFAGKARDVLLKITWDGAKTPAVLMPASDFFGYAWGEPAMSAALLGTHGDAAYCNLPMPYANGAKIELVSLRKGKPLEIQGEVVVGDRGRRPDEGAFYAVWRRENPTTDGKPFTWIDAKAKGHLVGLSLQAQGVEAGNTFFFEGDDVTVADGQRVVHGTGSEDFFNGGWYDVPGRWDRVFSRALSGCLGYQRPLGRTGGYRFFVNDAYPFERSLVQTIEHGPERNAHPADYCGVAYLYADRAPAAPALGPRPVVDPTRIVFTPHWTMPIEAFSLRNSTLTRGEIAVGNRRVRALSLRATSLGDFDLTFVTLRADLPSAGRYKVLLDAVKGPESGRVRLFDRTVDLYAPQPTEANGIELGEFTAAEGGNALMFKVEGKNPASTGLGLDLVNVVCVRLP